MMKSQILHKFSIGLLLGLGAITSLGLQAIPQQSDKEAAQEAYVEPKDMEVVEVRGSVNKNQAFFKRQVEIAELDFYDKFNDFSTESKFKVKCRREAGIGTRIKKTVCYPQYALDRMALETRLAIQSNVPPPTMKKIEDITKKEREESFVYMEEIIKKNPDVAKAFLKMHKAQVALEKWQAEH